MLWNKFPLIKFIILFAAGIIIQRYISFSDITLLLAFVVLLSLLGLLHLLKRHVFAQFVLVYILVVISGASYYHIRNHSSHEYPFNEKYISRILIKAEVLDIELPQDKRLSLLLRTECYYKDRDKFQLDEKILCNLYYANEAILKVINKLTPGNTITIAGTFREPVHERNPGEFDYKKYLLAKGITAQLTSTNPDDLVLIDESSSPVWGAVYKARLSIDKAIHSIYNHETAGLLRGLLLADRSLIDDTLQSRFVNAGVVHVLAVSGLHVGFIVMIFYFLFGRLNVILRYILTITGLFCFVMLTGATPSVVRASIMASALLVSLITNRTHNSFNALAFAAFILLVINPADLFNPGFQLSFAATLSIFIMLPLFQKMISRWVSNKIVKWFLVFIAVSLSAQIGTLPFTIFYFKKLSIISLFANLLVVPAIGMVVGIGIFTLVVYLFSNWLAGVFALANMVLVKLLFWLIGLLGDSVISHIEFPYFSLYDGVIFYTVLLLVFFLRNKIVSSRMKLVFYGCAVLLLFFLQGLDKSDLMPEGYLSILNVDLGNSECSIVKFPDGETALINAGGRSEYYDQGERTIIPLLKRNGVDKPDYVFLTSVSAPNNLGLISLIENGYVKKVYKPEVFGNDFFNIYFENYLEEAGVDYEYYKESEMEIGGVVVSFMPETKTYDEEVCFNIFNKSTPVKITYGNTSVLFPGNLEKRGEKVLSDKYRNFLRSDVLKVANNGSNIATSNNFLSYVKPKYSMINVQLNNWFGYPSKEVTENLTGAGSEILSTDKEGAILLRSDGSTFRQVNWKVD